MNNLSEKWNFAGTQEGQGPSPILQACQIWWWQAEKEGLVDYIFRSCIFSGASMFVCKVVFGIFWYRNGAKESKRRR